MMNNYSYFNSADNFRWTFEDADDPKEKSIRLAKSFCDKLFQFKANSIGLRLHGKVGTGKTFLVSCIANEIIGKNCGYYPVFIDFLSFIRKMIDYKSDSAEINNILEAPVVIIDDVDLNDLNKLEETACFKLFNARMQSGMLTIITTNIPSAELIEEKEEDSLDIKRVKSRLQELCPVGIVLTGRDRRESIGKEKRELALSLLKGVAENE